MVKVDLNRDRNTAGKLHRGEREQEFAIGPPNTAGRLTIPCWLNKKATAAFSRAEFSPVVRDFSRKV